MVTRAMIFGRFQPFHKGHLSIVKWAFEELGIDEIVLLVGMASENYTPRNPFTAGERIEMIRLSFRDEGLPLEKLVTATIHTLETSIGCVYYVLSYVPHIDYILSRNPVITRIFRDAGVNVVKPPLFNRDEWRGDRIRTLMARRNPRWKDAVTQSTAEFIESIGGVERVAELYSSD